MPAFTIVLHVPNRSINDPHDNCNNLVNEPSFFSKLENNDSMKIQSSNDRNNDIYILRLTLPYLYLLSTTLSEEERVLPLELEVRRGGSNSIAKYSNTFETLQYLLQYFESITIKTLRF